MMSNGVEFSVIDSFVGNTASPVLTSSRACPICGEFKDDSVLTFDDFQFFSDSATAPKRCLLRISQCRHCQAVYLNPSYTTAGFSCLFEEAGQSYGSSETRQLEQIGWLRERGLLGSKTSVLDVGCYDGAFLALLPESIRGFGVDIDEAAVVRGNELYGKQSIEIIHGAFESFICPERPDLIVMFHVLEHLANPFEVLVNLRSLSHDDTRLVVEVPVIEHGLTNDINGFFSVQHMTHFSHSTIGKLFAKAGWDILERVDMSGYNGHRLLAQPAAPSEYVQCAVRDRTLVYGYLTHWYKSLQTIAAKIDPMKSYSRIVIWGGGMHSEFLYQKSPLFIQNPKRQYLIVDSDPLKQGKTWRGINIGSPDIIRSMEWDDTLLLISSYGGQESIAKAAVEMGVPDTSIVKLYDDVSVY